MKWMILLYFPIGCMFFSWAGSWALRARHSGRNLALEFSRLLLLGFPFFLFAALLGKPMGPRFWIYSATALPARWLVVSCLAGTVGMRWVAEMVAGQAFRWRLEGADIERPAPSALLDAVEYELLRATMVPPWFLAWMPTPRLCLSKATNAGHLAAGLFPRICLDASLVPEKFREPDLWWQTVLPAPNLVSESLDPLKAVVAHELAHFRRADHLRTLATTFTGALLPWEWLFGRSYLGKTFLTRTWPFRWWSALMSVIGRPMRRWLTEERRIRETSADEAANRVVAQGTCHLIEVRELYPEIHWDEPICSTHSVPPVLCSLALLLLGAALLWLSPGRIPLTCIFGDDIAATDLPGGWCLTLDGRSKASAVYIPGRDGTGEVLVDCQTIDPSQPPEFRAVGRQQPGAIPSPCDVEMTWDVHFTGTTPLSGCEPVMSLTQSGSMVRVNPDLLAAYSVSAGPMAGLGRGWVRYSLTTRIHGSPQMDILFICFTFSAPGRYLFKPPVLSLILPSGQRLPYPAG
jgi:Zn-dependent protease with chaperone function